MVGLTIDPNTTDRVVSENRIIFPAFGLLLYAGAFALMFGSPVYRVIEEEKVQVVYFGKVFREYPFDAMKTGTISYNRHLRIHMENGKELDIPLAYTGSGRLLDLLQSRGFTLPDGR